MHPASNRMRWFRLHSVQCGHIPARGTSNPAHHKSVPGPIKRWCTVSKQKSQYYRIKSIQISKSEPQTERVFGSGVRLRLSLAFHASGVGKDRAIQRYYLRIWRDVVWTIVVLPPGTITQQLHINGGDSRRHIDALPSIHLCKLQNDIQYVWFFKVARTK